MKTASAYTDCRPVEWLWRPYVPGARITILDGDPGLGKSFVTLDICARLTRGDSFPGEEGIERPPMSVMICNCEDEKATTMVQRVKAAGANLDRVMFGDEVDPAEKKKAVNFLVLPDDRDVLLRRVINCDIKLCVIDPVMAFLAPEVKTYSDQAVRHALNCLNQIAEQTGCAFLLVRHLNKGGGAKAIYRGGGSIGFVGLARSGLMIAKHPDVPGKTLFLHAKSNLAARGPTLEFQLVFDRAGGRVKWRGHSEITADQAMRERRQLTEVERAEALLKVMLARGPQLCTDVLAAAGQRGISVKSVVRAKKLLVVFSQKKQTINGMKWLWSLQKPPLTGEEFLASLLEE